MALYSHNSYSTSIVKLQLQQLSENKAAHSVEVIRRALEITEPEFGDFKLEILKITMSGSRMSQRLLEGKTVNTVFLPANKEWDEKALVIRVPVRLGLLNYRLLLINKTDIEKFSQVNTLDDLNLLQAGLTTDWQTTKIYKLQNLSYVDTGHFEGIFLMLNKHRFDYLPRGIYEVYDELEARKDQLTDIVVEPTLALNIPMYTYIYVSPKTPEIAKRLESGLRKILANGDLKKLLYKYYAADIERANLKSRKIIKIENPYYSQEEQQLAQDLFSNSLTLN
ncbi:hypothetical protein [Colwellia echini]|uniref:Solute-binding protein family 3/N-terminal domain-containing protein n=1 Tax=Colwellia echini TaxID=1982103 RepID=A0ABY3MYN3_9GAMM|nr:hypothetical protein [Colwellia echini]TYK66336.1 hypothetical protein CWS31_005105 [Colwellia echini]